MGCFHFIVDRRYFTVLILSEGGTTILRVLNTANNESLDFMIAEERVTLKKAFACLVRGFGGFTLGSDEMEEAKRTLAVSTEMFLDILIHIKEIYMVMVEVDPK